MDTKTRLTNILKEHNQLKNSARMEETKMKYKENEAPKDKQSEPSAVIAKASDGTPMKKDAPQNDKNISAAGKENLIDKDKQAEPSQPVKPADGTPAKADASINDGSGNLNVAGKEAMEDKEEEEKKKEALPEEKEDEKKEALPKEDEKEPDYKERLKEMEDDMGKIVDVVESLKNSIDELNKKNSDMEERFKSAFNKDDLKKKDEPIAPQSESAILKGALSESIQGPAKKETFGDVARNIFK